MREEQINDNEKYHYTIERATRHDNGWEIGFEGWLCYTEQGLDLDIKPGQRLTQWGQKFGVIRGLAVDGVVLWYETEQEQRSRFEREQREQNAARKAKAEKEKHETDRRIAALPEAFQARLRKFTTNNPDFWWEFMDYELFTCEQAVLIAGLGSDDAVRKFVEMSWADRFAAVPNLSQEHSGNTFGMACQLAVDYLSKPQNVEERYGALAPLVGSEKYGCVPPKEPSHA